MKRANLPSVILCYHRIGDESRGSLSDLCTSESNFLDHLDFLKRKGYSFVSLDNFLPAEKGLCAITFDDGYRDNFTKLVPILQSRNIPVTVFVTSFHVSTGARFLPDMLCTFGEDRRERALVHNEKLTELSKQNLRDFYSNYEAVSRFDSGCSDGMPLTEQELCALSQTPGMSVGPHSVTHRSLAQISENEAEAEIIDSISYLRNLGVSSSAFFALPFGQGLHVNEAVSGKIREFGYTPLTTIPITPAAAHKCKEGLLGLPRLSVGPWDIKIFRRNLYLIFIGSVFPRLWLDALRFRQNLIRVRSLSQRIGL